MLLAGARLSRSVSGLSRFYSFSSTKMDVSKSFKDNAVVPDVVPEAPTAALGIKYPSGVEVTGGNVLTPTQVKDKPTITWQSEDKALYTLIFTDPDAPSRKEPAMREFCHWVVTNIPGMHIEKGDELAAFVGSGPPKDSGLHRYVFLLYKQPEHINAPKLAALADRRKWSATAFAQQYHMGRPIAGNLYQAEYDDYVPQLHEKLKAMNK